MPSIVVGQIKKSLYLKLKKTIIKKIKKKSVKERERDTGSYINEKNNTL